MHMCLWSRSSVGVLLFVLQVFKQVRDKDKSFELISIGFFTQLNQRQSAERSEIRKMHPPLPKKK